MTAKTANLDKTDVLVVGTGYLGKRVAQLAAGDETRVFTTTRRLDRFPELSRAGHLPLQIDWTDRRSLRNLPSLSPRARVVVAVSYDRRSSMGRFESQVGGLRNLLEVLPSDIRLCYISTTGVYHQTDGSWVDESSPAHPTRVGGRAHLRAEQLLHQMRPFAAWNVLRLAGIYGPNRVPRAADVVAGNPISSPDQGFLNLIHVQDAARAVMGSWERMNSLLGGDSSAGMQRRLYVVADNAPVVRGDFYREIARQCGAPAPRFVAPDANAPVKMRSDTNKRVSNRKMKRDLVPTLDFPDYRAGLADVLR